MQRDGLLASLGDRVEDIEQVARGSSEPIQPCYHQHVTVTDAFEQAKPRPSAAQVEC
jgi:hypothetical protein